MVSCRESGSSYWRLIWNWTGDSKGAGFGRRKGVCRNASFRKSSTGNRENSVSRLTKVLSFQESANKDSSVIWLIERIFLELVLILYELICCAAQMQDPILTSTSYT